MYLISNLQAQTSKAIGVAKKCCYCCYWLGNKLGYQLPGTHGIICPWAVPQWGLSTSVMEELETHLREKLQAELVHYANRTGRATTSTQSSPARTITNNPKDHEHLPTYEAREADLPADV
jgi:hypothetical protein